MFLRMDLVSLMMNLFFLRPRPKKNIFIHEPKYISSKARRYKNHDCSKTPYRLRDLCLYQRFPTYTSTHVRKIIKNRTENLKLDGSLQVKLCRFFIFDHSIHLRLLLRGRDSAFPCECKLLLIDYQVTRTSTGNTGARYKLIFVITPDHLGKQSHLIIAVNRVSAFIQVHT